MPVWKDLLQHGTSVLLRYAIFSDNLVLQMVSSLILVMAILGLAHFAVLQWRAIWVTAADHRLSQSFSAMTAVDERAIGASDFDRLLDLCDQFCPTLRNSSPWLGEVSRYYRIVGILEKASRSTLPALAPWLQQEMERCSRYVAFLLDQRLSAPSVAAGEIH